MIAKEYLIYKIKEIEAVVKNVHFKYAYDNTTGFHIIEISPQYIREENEEYALLECNIWSEFYDLYPNEDIVISGPNKFNRMTNIIYETPLELLYMKSLDIEVQKISNYYYEMSSNYDNINIPIIAA